MTRRVTGRQVSASLEDARTLKGLIQNLSPEEIMWAIGHTEWFAHLLPDAGDQGDTDGKLADVIPFGRR